MIYAAAITGPTASGKTALSVRVAKALGATVFSADSMQIYREMNIGTAKIRPEEMEGVAHKMLDVASVREDFSTHAYKEMVLPLARESAEAGSIPLFVLPAFSITKSKPADLMRAQSSGIYSPSKKSPSSKCEATFSPSTARYM